MSDVQALINERLEHESRNLLSSNGVLLGIDLGGYGLRAALIDLERRHFQSIDIEFPTGSPDHIVEQGVVLARRVLHEAGIPIERLVRIAVGFGGPVDLRHGVVRLSPRLPGWENYPLQERFESAFDTVTLIDNDANLIALGEATFGSGHGTQNLCYFHLSSGVGGGMVLNGRVHHGATSTAGEIGHAVVGRGWDGTGRPETLEELVSIAGLLRRMRMLGLDTNDLKDLFGPHPAAKQVLQETIDLMATRIAQTVALLDPEIVVLGGITVRIGGDEFVQAIATKAKAFIAPQFAQPTSVVASILGPDSVTVGALALALDSLSD